MVRLTLPRRVVMHENPGTGEAVTPQTAVAEATESAAPRFAGVFAIVLPAGLLVQALIDHDSYRHRCLRGDRFAGARVFMHDDAPGQGQPHH